MPKFPGGEAELLKYISTSIVYPKEAQESGIQGQVVCSLVVNTDGSITNVKVVRNGHELLDAEAIRVIKEMPKWAPGKIDGKAVRVLYTIPIVFRLS